MTSTSAHVIIFPCFIVCFGSGCIAYQFQSASTCLRSATGVTNPIIPNAQHDATIDENHSDVHVNIYLYLTTKMPGPEVLVLAERRRQKIPIMD